MPLPGGSGLVTLTIKFSWSWLGGCSSSPSPCGVRLNLLIGAPDNPILFMRRAEGAGVVVSCEGVLLTEPCRDILILLGLCTFFGLSICSASRSSFVIGLRFTGAGISSSELSPSSPMDILCSGATLDENPCDGPSIDDGEPCLG